MREYATASDRSGQLRFFNLRCNYGGNCAKRSTRRTTPASHCHPIGACLLIYARHDGSFARIGAQMQWAREEIRRQDEEVHCAAQRQAARNFGKKLALMLTRRLW
jgi:hypothetical protein